MRYVIRLILVVLLVAILTSGCGQSGSDQSGSDKALERLDKATDDYEAALDKRQALIVGCFREEGIAVTTDDEWGGTATWSPDAYVRWWLDGDGFVVSSAGLKRSQLQTVDICFAGFPTKRSVS